MFLPFPSKGERSLSLDFGYYARLEPAAQKAEWDLIQRSGKFDHPLERAIKLNREQIDVEKRTATFAASSEEPVLNWWGFEILSHKRSAVRLERLNAAAPLLVNHDVNQHIGVVEKAWIEGNRMMVTVRFGKNEDAEEIFQDVIDGIRPNVSIGYRIYQVKDITQKGDSAPTMLAIDWEPFEVTSGSIPADFKKSGLGRSLGNPEGVFMLSPEKYAELKGHAASRALTAEELAQVAEYESHQRTLAPPPAPVPAPVFPAHNPAPAVDVQAVVSQSIQAERQRTAQINLLASQHGQGNPAAAAAAAQYIAEGRTVAEFSQHLLTLRATPEPMPSRDPGQPAFRSMDLKNYSVLKALNEAKDGKLTGLEKEVQEEHRRTGQAPQHNGVIIPLAQLMSRTMSAGVATSGGVMIETENMGMVELLRNRTMVAAMGARVLDGLVGDISFKRQTADGTAYWVGESVDVTASTPGLGEINGTLKTVGARYALTRKLRKQTSGSAETFARESLAKTLGLAVDKAALTGAGSAAQPLGLLNTSGIGSVSGTSLAWAGIVEFESDVASANADVASMGFLTTPSVRGKLKQRTQVSGGTTPPFIWGPDGKVNGYRAEVTMQMLADAMIFGDFSQLLLAMWGSPEFALIDQGANYAQGEQEIIVFQDMDVLVLQPGAFSLATSIS